MPSSIGHRHSHVKTGRRAIKAGQLERRLARLEVKHRPACLQPAQRRYVRFIGSHGEARGLLALQGVSPDEPGLHWVHRIIVEPDGTIGDQGPAMILSGA